MLSLPHHANPAESVNEGAPLEHGGAGEPDTADRHAVLRRFRCEFYARDLGPRDLRTDHYRVTSNPSTRLRPIPVSSPTGPDLHQLTAHTTLVSRNATGTHPASQKTKRRIRVPGTPLPVRLARSLAVS